MSSLDTLPIGQQFPFESRYLEAKSGHRLRYVDQGAGTPVVFLHGNPTSSYAFRNVIPYLTDYARCVAVDLIGMGRSDKPDIGYTFSEHVDYISAFIDRLGLKEIILVGHDWGATIGMQYAANRPGNVKAVAMIEPQALYPLASWSDFSPPESQGLFQTLRDPEKGWPFMRDNNVFVEGMPNIIVNRRLTPEEHEHYREPFRNPEDRKPMWVFPNQIPIEGTPGDVVQAVEERNVWLRATDIPKILFYASPGCTVRKPQLDWCGANMRNLTTIDIGKGFHHLLEENPHAIGQELARWFNEIR
ncbi:haloalkane dehalogenase [Cohnella lupini]|uniref:Haloalkane dehalogenase n=1 Tax=Cohnella lupini TaxID=1294267 RepID=A0A3D9HNQ8_9BACL|nr:haloalkane dehalogenase [Cohnella lupini]RED51109.1 haloalkane dehalogenase [Cohnella lupini]